MKKRDIIFICAILALSAILFVAFGFLRRDGAYVSVKVDGKEIATFSLLTDGEYILNGGTNRLVIKNGKASLHDSSCPDRLCEKLGEISKSGETITCLPNRLTVTVHSSEQSGVELVG